MAPKCDRFLSSRETCPYSETLKTGEFRAYFGGASHFFFSNNWSAIEKKKEKTLMSVLLALRLIAAFLSPQKICRTQRHQKRVGPVWRRFSLFFELYHHFFFCFSLPTSTVVDMTTATMFYGNRKSFHNFCARKTCLEAPRTGLVSFRGPLGSLQASPNSTETKQAHSTLFSLLFFSSPSLEPSRARLEASVHSSQDLKHSTA